MKRGMAWTLSLIGIVLVAACGGYPEPKEQLTAAQAAIRAAEVGGAEKDPQPALRLKHAREQVEKAKLLIDDGDNERAESILERAEIDADLAMALAKEIATKAEAQAAVEEMEKLKKEGLGEP